MSTTKAYSPREINRMTHRVLPWGGEWARVFGQPGINATWLIQGQSASGKSSFVMQLAKELCRYGVVLYESYEEGVSKSMQDRIRRYHMTEQQGRFRVAIDDGTAGVAERLRRRKSARFVIVDSFQESGWSYEEAKELVKAFPRKCFIFVSQEVKNQPLGKPALRLKYLAGVKVRVSGFKAYCQGRAVNEAGAVFTVWADGIIQTTNDLPLTTNDNGNDTGQFD